MKTIVQLKNKEWTVISALPIEEMIQKEDFPSHLYAHVETSTIIWGAFSATRHLWDYKSIPEWLQLPDMQQGAAKHEGLELPPPHLGKDWKKIEVWVDANPNRREWNDYLRGKVVNLGIDGSTKMGYQGWKQISFEEAMNAWFANGMKETYIL